MKKHKRPYLIIPALIVILTAAFFIYTASYYHADPAVNTDSPNITVSSDRITISPSSPSNTGIIFYPGGKVEAEAYIPLLSELADKGYFCVLAKMPFHLAVFSPNSASKILDNYPEIQSWYIAGHSLGGAMAANFAYTHSDELDGMILLAAYSTKDLSSSSLEVLSVYGTEDGVMNRESYEKYKSNLPEDWAEYVIDGGNHANFGYYGDQDGDGTSAISREEQIEQTVGFIDEHINFLMKAA